jgi:hypothetical protein
MDADQSPFDVDGLDGELLIQLRFRWRIPSWLLGHWTWLLFFHLLSIIWRKEFLGGEGRTSSSLPSSLQLL